MGYITTQAKPVKKHIRGLAWIVLRWAGTVRPRVIILENVEEFRTWGPLESIRDTKTGRCLRYIGDDEKGKAIIQIAEPKASTPFEEQLLRPKRSKAGKTFRKWKNQLEALGYKLEWRELIAANYGAPTTRKRFFLVARCDGQPIVWPETTHAPADSYEVKAGLKKPWRPASEIIDWSLPTPSIFDSKVSIKAKYGVNAIRPLAPNTMRRVIRGVDKFVIKSRQPFLVPIGYGERKGQQPRVHDVSRPLPTSVGTAKHGVCRPQMEPLTMHKNENAAGTDVRSPVNTITGSGIGGHQMLISPTMTAIGQTGGGNRNRRVDQPTHTTVSKAEECLVYSSMIQYHAEQSDNLRGQNVNKPLLTVDSANRYGLTAATMAKYYGNDVHGQDIHDPLHTVTGKDREGLIALSMTEYHGTSIGGHTGAPVPTVLSKEHQGVMAAHLSKYYGGYYTGDGSNLRDPVHTVTAVDHNALGLAHMTKMKGDNLGSAANSPLQTITAGGGHFGAVITKIVKVDIDVDLHHWPEIRTLLNRHCGYQLADNEVILFLICGAWYFIADIGLRMLSPRELYMANGFPVDYIIERDYQGNVYIKSKQVARCGNSVPLPLLRL